MFHSDPFLNIVFGRCLVANYKCVSFTNVPSLFSNQFARYFHISFPVDLLSNRIPLKSKLAPIKTILDAPIKTILKS